MPQEEPTRVGLFVPDNYRMKDIPEEAGLVDYVSGFFTESLNFIFKGGQICFHQVLLLLEVMEVETPVRFLKAPSKGEGISDHTYHLQVEAVVKPSGRHEGNRVLDQSTFGLEGPKYEVLAEPQWHPHVWPSFLAHAYG